MNTAVEVLIEELVDIIYSVDQNNLDQTFISLLDAVDENLRENAEQNSQTKVQEALFHMQEAYVKKDYVEFADVLLYEIKPIFLSE